MRLNQLELNHFRNIAGASLRFEGNRHFFIGANGQGKTNVLEAIAFAQGLKSFRTAQRVALIEHGAAQAVIRGTWQHEKRGETVLAVGLEGAKRSVKLDGALLKSAAETFGVFPVVALSLADREIVYGAPAVRRGEVDDLICHIDPAYVGILAEYEAALKSRNALLGDPTAAPEAFAAFEVVMAAAARRLIRSRARALELLAPSFQETFSRFAPAGEMPQIVYTPNTPFEELPDLWASLRTTKDRYLQQTTKGPHRDNYQITLNGYPAELYASEGQKFSLVLALKLAGLNFLREQLGVAPVLVCDDLLLELDKGRQERFWQCVGDLQVFASGTTLPATGAGDWQVWNVEDGSVKQQA